MRNLVDPPLAPRADSVYCQRMLLQVMHIYREGGGVECPEYWKQTNARNTKQGPQERPVAVYRRWYVALSI